MFNRIPEGTPKWLVALGVMLGLILTLQVWLLVRDATKAALVAPISITACSLEDYTDDDSCEGDPLPASGATLDLDDTIRVVGDVCSKADEPVDVEYTVSWKHIGQGTEFVVLDEFPATIEPGCVTYGLTEPGIVWVVPDQLTIGFSAGQLVDENGDPLTDLGDWAVVGRVDPVERTRWESSVWNSSGTFRLVVEND